jgi:predicted DNA-binding protein (UPF0251 family)
MPRPVKCRRVAAIPGVNFFKPAGVPLRELDETCLTVEEMEALRLKDMEAMDQQDCAQQMSISRPTFQRVLQSARKKMADALLNGKAIRIEGGNFRLALQRMSCVQGHTWTVPFESQGVKALETCPQCSRKTGSPPGLEGET